MPTLRDYRHEVARKLGGFKLATVTLAPDPLDTLAQRQVLSAALYDSDKGSKGYSNQFCWVGKYRDQRRFRESGYRSLAYSVFIPPASGTYTLTFYGYGTTDPIAFGANSATVQAAIVALGAGLATVTVSGDGNPFVISLPDVIDTEISAGTMVSTGGIGAIEVQRGFTRALVPGDEIEIHSRLPVEDDDNIQGLNALINMALRRMWFIDKFPITPVTNSRGVKTFYGLEGEPWMTNKRQLIAIYGSTLHELVATFTPPGSGTYTLQLTNAPTTYITDELAFDATGQAIQDELQAETGLNITVSPLGSSATYTITLPETYYAVPTLAASTGTVVNVRNRLEEPTRHSTVTTFEYDGETPYIKNYLGQEGQSFFIEAYRPALTWICPQASYGVLGDTWESSTEGLVDDYDQAVPTIEAVASVVYGLACRQLANMGPAHERGAWEDEARRAERGSAATKLYDLPFNDKPSGGAYYGMPRLGHKGFWSAY